MFAISSQRPIEAVYPHVICPFKLNLEEMDQSLAAVVQPQSSSGPLWFQDINLDVLFSIVSWLDPRSILQLSCTCKAFRAAIWDDYPTWRHALQRVADEHCTAPHSFDNASTSDLKAFSTRPARLIDALHYLEQPVHAMMTKCMLDYGTLLPTPTSSETGRPPELEYLTATLLPGGRWIISGALDHDNRSTYIGCWDLSKLHSDETPLQPVTTFVWDGFRPRTTHNWMQAQPCDSESVMIACGLSQWAGEYTTSYEVLCLGWGSDGASPSLKVVAQSPADNLQMLHHSLSEWHLEDDYLIIDTMDSVIIWDWKQNCMGIIDDERHEWVWLFFASIHLIYI
ncbi:hypothetical protein DL93DRAFT_2101063 [Clavulina sp. PMI_390]|nr:hypothetical protein DL93DRAFT_2101063 [Clavulina sp. PMI_390]